jgi:hypothetical protein
MRAVVCAGGTAERAMRAHMLSVLEELCQDMTLHDVREWYVDSMAESTQETAGAGGLE